MKRLMIFILAACVSGMAFSQDTRSASPASIEKLLEITETKQMYAATMKEMTQLVDQSSARMLKRIPDDRQPQFKQVMAKLDTIIQEEMSWDKMKPQYVKIYAEIFTQQEIDDLLAFYQTPSGKSFIKKQPLVIQKTAALSQEIMGSMIERLPDLMQQVMTEGN